ncbi:MAG: hypothetical protein Q7U09_13725 [Hydrogenophaga sp.]|nr:hypothetical protein [Hydrogenophaga sp.]
MNFDLYEAVRALYYFGCLVSIFVFAYVVLRNLAADAANGDDA